MSNQPMIEVKNIFMSYKVIGSNISSLKEYIVKFFKRQLNSKTRCVLKDVSFTVNKGEVLGVIGVNGAGKSTLLRVITGIYKPQKGSVVCHGKITPFLGLGSGFDKDLNGYENIYLNAAILGYSKEEVESKIDKIIAFSELSEETLKQPVRTYSSGMMMRLGFSVAAEMQPEILILDEVLAVGDDRFKAKSKARITELIKGDATVLMVTHNAAAIKTYCNRAIWLEKGSVKMIGNAKEIVDAYTNRK